MSNVVNIRAAAPVKPRPFIRPDELAKYLNVSERTVRQMLADRVIASYRVGGQRRVSWDDVEDFLASHRDKRA